MCLGGFAKNKQGVYPSVNQRTFRVKRRDGGASVDATGDESMFDPSTLVFAVGKFIEVVVSPETSAG